MVILDASIVNIALPSIGHGLHISLANLSWVVNAYVLTFGGFLLLGGRIADLVGRRRIFTIGLAVFSAASLAGGLAQSEAWLIAARAAQGLGAGLLAPAALSLVTSTFREGTERNKALSVWGAVAGSGAAAGVLLGGVLTSWLGWRSVLFVNVPIGIAAMVLTPALIVESRGEAAGRGFDLPGAATVTAGLSALVYALVRASTVGWGSPQTIGVLAAAALLLVAFFVIERRSQAPLVPFAFFRNRSVTAANVTMLGAGAAVIAVFYFLSLYLQEVLGYSAITTGLAQLPLAAGTILAAGLASPLVNRLGIRRVLIVGLTLFAGGLVLFAQLPVHGRYLANVLGPSMLVALGLGFAFVPITILSQTGVHEREYGLASGLVNTSQQIGGALGLAVLTTIATSRTNALVATHHPINQAVTLGFHSGFLGGAGFVALAAIAAATIGITRNRVQGSRFDGLGKSRRLALRDVGAPSGFDIPPSPVDERHGPDQYEKGCDAEPGDIDVEVRHLVPEGAVKVKLVGEDPEDLDGANDERGADRETGDDQVVVHLANGFGERPPVSEVHEAAVEGVEEH
jgi:EmrB/QacA subfamily drug resistance transporter